MNDWKKLGELDAGVPFEDRTGWRAVTTGQRHEKDGATSERCLILGSGLVHDVPLDTTVRVLPVG